MDNPETLAALGQQDTGHRTKTNKSKRNKINKAKKMNNTNLTTKRVVNPGARQGSAVSKSYKILGVIAHHIYCPLCECCILNVDLSILVLV